MIDYHLHTPLCCHATGAPEEYLARAHVLGLKEIGFADHFPLELLGKDVSERLTMTGKELPDYVRSIKELSAEPGSRVAVRLGTELDYIRGRTEKAASILDSYPFDYIIGSLHYLGDWDFTHPDFCYKFLEWELDDLYRQYFALVWEACYSNLFDIFGHIDGLKKFGYRPQMRMDPLWAETAAALKENNICLEINTAGLSSPVGEMYPEQGLLKHCFRAGVPVTLGSDAHRPGDVARGFTEAVKLLYNIGYREIISYKERHPQKIPLETVV